MPTHGVPLTVGSQWTCQARWSGIVTIVDISPQGCTYTYTGIDAFRPKVVHRLHGFGPYNSGFWVPVVNAALAVEAGL